MTILEIADGLQCNPAYNSLTTKSVLGIELLLSNGQKNLGKVQKLLGGKVNQELVDTLFSDGQIIQIEAGAEVLFRSKYLSGKYVPVSVRGFSVVRNEANPDVELSAVEESGFSFQSGYEIMEGLYAGLQTRFIRRRFIRQRFKLLEAATPEGKELLKPKTQTASYYEPGVSYISPWLWRPRVSLFLANFGSVSQKYQELDSPVELQGGIGISPPLPYGELQLSVEYRSLTYEETPIERLRAGALYKFGSMSLTGGIDSNGLSSGVYYELHRINAGISYSTTRLSSADDEYYTQTVYVQLGWQI